MFENIYQLSGFEETNQPQDPWQQIRNLHYDLEDREEFGRYQAP